MTESQSLLLAGSDSLRSRFNQYKIMERLNNPEIGSTPDYTPSVVTSRLARLRPQIYRARDTKGQTVAIKVVYSSSLELLENEWKALDRLKWLQRIPLIPKIAPKLKEGMHFDFEHQIYFIIYEWIDGWISIGEYVRTYGPLINLPDAIDVMNRLRRTLLIATKLLHSIGIIHGDNKDEHVFLKSQNGDKQPVAFNQIKLIDFGGCYLHNLEDWKGGSLGFSSPYFWNQKHRYSLSRRELEALDWYSVYSILFYAYTGECFPAASPAYSSIPEIRSDSQSRSYYSDLKYALTYKWQNHPENIQFLISETVEYLCSPYSLIVPSLFKLLIEQKPPVSKGD